MSAPALNAALPASTPGAIPGGVTPGGTSAASAFSAVLGVLFGGQDGLAAQLLAGAQPGGKPAAEDSTEGSSDAQADAAAASQGLAGALLVLPPLTPTTTTTTTPAATNPEAPAGATSTGLTANSGIEHAIDVGQTTPAARKTDAAGEPSPPPGLAAALAALQGAGTDEPPPAPKGPVATATPAPSASPAGEGDAAAASLQAIAAQTPPPAAQAAAGATPSPRNASAEKPQAKGDSDPAAPVAAAGARTPAAPPAGQTATNGEANLAKDPKPGGAEAVVADAQPEVEDRHAQAPAAPTLHAPVAAPQTHAAAPLRATAETVVQMAAQISKQLEGRSTHFDFELTPAGLGRVDVRIEISAHGQLTAAMSFENPNAAAEMRHRSGELARALEQAGFDLAGGLSFDVAGDRGQAGQGAQQQRSDGDEAWRGRAFQAALDAAGETDAAAASALFNSQRRSNAGVDIRI